MTAVRELMTRDPACVETDQTLQEAAEIMSRMGVGALPICGPDRKIKGVLTDRDLVVRALAEGKSLSTTAGELNQGEAITVGADDPAEELFATMTQYQVKRLPVIDGQMLVGIVTIADAAKALSSPTVGQLTDALSTA